MTRILSLDLATICGWAVSGGGVITSGSQDFSRYGGSKSRRPDHVGESFAMFHRWLAEKLRTDKPDVIAYESAGHFKSGAAVQVLVGMRGIMLCAAATQNIPVTPYAPAAVKKFWTGKGTADKIAMVAMTRKRCPDVDLTDSNEADALAILHLHLSRQRAIAAA